MSQPAVFILGNFDGVHRGHQKLIREALQFSRNHEKHPHCSVLTFWPHPQAVLQTQKSMHLLTTEEERTFHLRSHGVDDVITLEFTRDFSRQTWEAFVRDILLHQPLSPIAVFVGADFRFGQNRAGTPELLRKHLQKTDISVHVVQKIQSEDSLEISSSRIRALLLEGGIEEANKLLGWTYSMEGSVHRHDGRGKKIGFPTANLRPAIGPFGQKLVPCPGVYITKSFFDRKSYPSVTNVGYRPTFKSEDAAQVLEVETHILDGSHELYGKNLRVEFYQRLRGEEKFSSVNDLTAQIKKDCEAAREYWKLS